VVFAFVEVMIVRFAFGVDRFWEELHEGADLRVPEFFRFVLKWLSPAFLTILLVWWGWTEARGIFVMEGVPPEQVPWRWASRLTIVAMLVAGMILIQRAWRRRANEVPARVAATEGVVQ